MFDTSGVPARRAVRGLPARMARVVGKLFADDQRKAEVVEELLWDDQRLPLAVDGKTLPVGAIFHAAEAAAQECYRHCQRLLTKDAGLIAVGMVCRQRGVPLPVGREDAEVLARAVDKAWWRRQLRKEWARRFEHTAIQLGLTGLRTDPYVSRETCLMQEAQNRENQKMLAASTAVNENGDKYSLGDLAALGMGNKTLRRGELMLRIRGFEEVADDLGHVGMFWTITCPSKFHSVGGTNPNYNGATPRDAQRYLCDVWKCIRSALKRAKIQPYGFRIAEPHSDGCPHWHMLFFVEPRHVTDMEMIVTAYAMREDEEEKGAHKARVKLVHIEAGKGTAAGYIAKYVSKNIDGAGVGDHKTFENGTTYVIAPDLFGNVEITASQRVTYWSQVWGIRQFQQIGGAPVGVWRELRRVAAEAVADAPQALRDAHQACQKIESDNPAVAKQASFAAYLMAQGGPTVGRQHVIRIACKEVTVNGRYAVYVAEKPVGVYMAGQPHAVYEGVHYTWDIQRPGAAGGVAFDLPWTGVNNCTRSASDKPFWEGAARTVAASGPNWEYRKNRPIRPAPALVAAYQKYRRRPDGAPSAHLEYLLKKYPTE
jgi:hypothetical protein